MDKAIQNVAETVKEEQKRSWKTPLIVDMPIAIGTKSVALGNNDGVASHS